MEKTEIDKRNFWQKRTTAQKMGLVVIGGIAAFLLISYVVPGKKVKK